MVLKVEELEVYKLARELSRIAWDIYKEMNWQNKKVIGEQFITAIDSIGANITEGYGRFHYLDRVKFFYNARASLCESIFYWLELLKERELINDKDYKQIQKISKNLMIKLNNLIKTTRKSKNEK
ncbi:MAG: hypothetical protein KatS3mg095_0780 [Candidatus Parcubacteria bacterium]|nr:MAG: hypothetical protein KatS3mg095_0780 [Candidatus Parcubacteria bacterium]